MLLLSAIFLSIALPAHSQTPLPDGTGKQTIQVVCSYCHGLDRVTETRLTPQEWKDLVNLMVVYGASVRPADVAVVIDYLSKNFKGEPKPKGAVIPGPVQASIKEWVLPTPGTRPHDPAVAPDGSIWYTGQASDLVGRFDPATNQFSDMVGRIIPATGDVKVVHVPTPKAEPYGIVVNSKGVPFFVELMGHRVASIDPKTMEIKEYVLPNADAMPRRIAVTPDDVVWYTDYVRGYLGRFDPKTGKLTEWPSPSGRTSQPYGITAVGNILYYSESNVAPNTVVRFDPATEKMQTWLIPSGGGVVRFMTHGADGSLWLACSGVDRIARVEIR